MARDRDTGFGWVAIGLHWLIAVLILGLIALGFVMRRMKIDPLLQFSLYQWHKSIGLVVLGLALLRVLWWILRGHPAAVAGLGPLERRASVATHVGLAILTLAVPLAGWAVASTSTLNIPTFFFNLFVFPHLPLAQTESAETFWTEVHALAAYVMLGLVGLHAAAAFHHHLFRKDEVLTRMLGIRRRPDAANRTPAGSKEPGSAGRM
ncbi:cytochrome b [Sinorhizobium sp. BG8]|uniref:cytochrome b n=1 Tax=Sinorhizobium sp. BG8 TaxID=2613773 RepID=UPI00193D4E3B|nr:cytochrome b [Sinorhizobium sp. BG8]QRM54680.1 cytochrome b [Sinorhizobium sp. BG8]